MNIQCKMELNLQKNLEYIIKKEHTTDCIHKILKHNFFVWSKVTCILDIHWCLLIDTFLY